MGLWVEIAGARWLNTGDLGRQDGDGYFWLTGRRKELIIRGGHNIDPKMIEEAVQEHPAVALVAAIGRPDAYAGEVPVAFVQLKPAASATEQELLDFAAGRIAERAAVPKHVPALPLTNVGKIFKPALQQRETEGVIRSEADAVRATILGVEIEQEPLSGPSFGSASPRALTRCGRRWSVRLQVRGFVIARSPGAADALAERGGRSVGRP